MTFNSIIDADELFKHLDDPAFRIIDCRYNLNATEEGLALYNIEHIPNAVYAHLKRDLSSPVTKTSGRHPLPDVTTLKLTLGHWGIDDTVQVVVYDNAAGSYAARLWWLLRWLGHNKVAVLNGGYDIWKRQGMPITAEIPQVSPRTFDGTPDMTMIADTRAVEELLTLPKTQLIDVRDPERYQGRIEPIDKIAGHIPGAINVPWKKNIDENGLYLSKAQLYDHYKSILHVSNMENTVFMCGSGVTACHSLVALTYIGMTGSKLYPGSWSEWITDPEHPVAASSL